MPMTIAESAQFESPSTLLEGTDPTTAIVAVEPFAGSQMAIYRRRSSGDTTRDLVPFQPWLIARDSSHWQSINQSARVEELHGEHPLRFLVSFPSWSAFQEASQRARENRNPYFEITSAVDQYLIVSGQTLFKGMVFEEVRRLQIDIETTSLDPTHDDARVVLAALRSNLGDERAVAGNTERELLLTINEIITEIDPDVIEGHNIFNFDIPFLAERAQRNNVELSWGRDHSPIRIGQRQQRFKAGPLSLPFRSAYVHGRHIIDTYQQLQRYDVAGRLTSYGLKPAIEALGLTREGREFVAGDRISEVWRSEPQRLERYAIDDVRDVDLLSRLTLPTEFYQAQLLPKTFQQVAVVGPGMKINDLMLRAYLSQGESVPLPGDSRGYPGGHAELLRTGVFSPVVKCDVESLYPSIMLSEGITSKQDTLGAYLPMLRELTHRRLHAKSMSRRTSGDERAMWEGLQGSFKVLINSFYGYLGFGAALFNDFDAAERVTLSGHRHIKSIVTSLSASGGTPIEVDTDGVYFVPPQDVASFEDELSYIERIGSALPAGIRLAHDGRYQSMLSLQLKNYALLGYDGEVTLKGSALRSRRLELCFRAFIDRAALAFMSNDRDAARRLYFEVAERIKAREVAVTEIVQWTMIHDSTVDSQPRLKRLITRHSADIHAGERVQLYERNDGELALISEYAHDENGNYLLRRLRDSAGRFEALFASYQEFDAFFPALTLRTDFEQAREQQSTTQLSLFESS
jgi:DNA polymerase I